MSRRQTAAPTAATVGANYRPRIHLVPFPLWGMNMRALMTRTEWRKLRLALLEKQGVVCSTCGKEESAPGRVYAHEEWEYDESVEPAIAHITGVSLVCWHCHACEHWGCINSLVGSGALTAKAIDDTIAHFCRLNGTTKAAFKAHQADAYEVWIRRCKRKWRVDYGVFAGWTSKTFERDPLNDEPWSAAVSRVSRDEFRPTMAEIVAPTIVAARDGDIVVATRPYGPCADPTTPALPVARSHSISN